MTPLVYRIAFADMQGMGVDLARKLLDVIGSEERFFAMSERELRDLTRGRSKIYRDDYRRERLQRAEREAAFVTEHGISAIYFTDENYPHRLAEAPDAPAMIYTLGNCDLESTHIISVVGTRHATQYGIRFCDTLIGDLAQRLPDLVVVSGLAYGIDIATHRAVLKHGARTVAVLPRGLNRIYPATHRNDAIAIVNGEQTAAVLLRYHPQRDGGTGSHGLSGTAAHLGRPGTERDGIPVLRGHADRFIQEHDARDRGDQPDHEVQDGRAGPDTQHGLASGLHHDKLHGFRPEAKEFFSNRHEIRDHFH